MYIKPSRSRLYFPSASLDSSTKGEADNHDDIMTEKCFITPSDQRLGLTISGFYYISLRRSDGFVEGLYYDPASTPYQHLVLYPLYRSFPTYQFR